MDEAEYANVLTATAAAASAGGLSPEELQECYRLQGEAQVALGRVSAARDAFSQLLVLNPEAKLGEFVSPKITEVLESARTELGGKALVGKTHALENGRVALEVVADPKLQVAGAELQYMGQDGVVVAVRAEVIEGRAEFEVPATAKVRVYLRAVDSAGNALLSSAVNRLVAASAASPARSTNAASGPLYSQWWVWAAGGATAAVVGVGFGAASSSAQGDLDAILSTPSEHFYREAMALEDKARFRAGMANFSFVVAGGMAAASVFLYMRSSGADESSPVLVPAVGPDGASSLILMGAF